LDKTLLAHFLNIQFVSYYNVAGSLLVRAKEIPVTLTSAILPAASEIHARMDSEKLKSLYFRSLKYVVIISFPLVTGILLFGDYFIFLWMGEGFEKSALTIKILISSYFFNILTAPGAYILNGVGKPQYAMYSALIAIPVNLALSIWLVIKIGYYGVVIGTAVSLFVSAIYFLFVMHYLMKLSYFEWFKKIFVKPLSFSFMLFLCMQFVIRNVDMYRWSSFVSAACLFVIVFSLLVWYFNYFDTYDMELFKRYYKLIKQKLIRS